MLNSTAQSVKINTPATGMIQRSCGASFFIRFDIGSELSARVFNDDCRYRGEKATVLQVMMSGVDKVIVEIMYVEKEEGENK